MILISLFSGYGIIYDSARAAVTDYNSDEVESIIHDLKESNPDEKISEEDEENECLHFLNENTSVIEMDDGSVIVYTEY